MINAQAKKNIRKAIYLAEQKTSGEIRVHLDKKGGNDPFDEGKKVFEKLGMTNTEARNGVLIYLCFNRKQIAILGDKGIHELVPDTFWDNTYKRMAEAFKKGAFEEGICAAIHEIGLKLSLHFPVNNHNPDELSNEITES